MPKKWILPFGLFLFILVLLALPSLCIQAAQQGLLLWFNKVLPSLLPFMILINMLTGLDSVKKLSQTASSITYKLWKLPGCSLFAFIMGFIAGYPMGGKVIKQLVCSGDLSLSEGERALCFCNNCGPLFIIGTVGTALLGHTSLGYFLLFVHILSAFLISLLLPKPTTASSASSHLALRGELIHEKSFATLLNEAVMNAMDTIVCVGGYIIFFSVLTQLITQTPLLTTFCKLPFINQLPSDALAGALTGIFELSNGVATLSGLEINCLTLSLLSAVIGFGGLCVYFQTLYVLNDLSLSTKPYLLSKCLQAFLSFTLTGTLYPLFFWYTKKTIISFSWAWPLSLILLIAMIFIGTRLFYNLSHHNKSVISSTLSKDELIKKGA